MGRKKLLRKLLSGVSDADINFNELCNLLKSFGFDIRVNGSHHIFRREGVEEKLNLQNTGGRAKPYQVKQVRNVILKYKLGGDLDV